MQKLVQLSSNPDMWKDLSQINDLLEPLSASLSKKTDLSGRRTLTYRDSTKYTEIVQVLTDYGLEIVA